ncbi:MAG: GYD domain-containing protein, partial [Chloroflexi bacterium]|nr:GYD domain-containing protein [Chloroflexota bacterium]
MATYILLISATEQGREKILGDPHVIRSAEEEMGFSGAEILGLYAVLGNIDFVAILEAEDNETAARFTLELGVRA